MRYEFTIRFSVIRWDPEAHGDEANYMKAIIPDALHRAVLESLPDGMHVGATIIVHEPTLA